MIKTHQRAALIPNEPGVNWTHFLKARFVGSLPHAGSDASLVVTLENIEQQSQEHANVRGLLEVSSGGSLPVVFAFVGVLKLDTREISLRQTQPDKVWEGQISENGRVMILRQAGQSKLIHLVDEETLSQLI